MIEKPNNAEEAIIIVREAIKCIRGRREIAEWHHGNTHGLISAFLLVGLLEKGHIRRLNIEADDAMERVTMPHPPKLDI